VEHDLLAVCCHYPFMPLPEGIGGWGAEELRFGIHGGAVETSMMAHLRPDLVQWEHALDFKSHAVEVASECELLFPHGGAVGYGWMAQDLAASGVVGDATNADSERGEEVVRFYGTQLATLLAEVSRADCEQLLRSRSSGPLRGTR
jgi:creatinine amidohydrolase